MANSRVRCSFCRHYILKEDVFLDCGIGRFCSSECVSDSQTAKQRKAKDKARQAKRRAQPVKPTRHIPSEIRDEVRVRDGCCRWCGGKGQEVHHIKYRSEGGPDHPHNLIFLCQDCHLVAHSSKRAYQELLQLYVWTFYVECRKLMIPEVASALRRADLLSDLQLERLYPDEFAAAAHR